jgi:hypothetical protein
VWIDEYAQHEKLHGLILSGDSETIEMSCPECGAEQSCPLEVFDIDEFEFFHEDYYCPNDPNARRRHEWAALWDDDNHLCSFTLEAFIPPQEARITVRATAKGGPERISSRDQDDLALFVARVIVPALLARLRREREDPGTVRVFVTLEWRMT